MRRIYTYLLIGFAVLLFNNCDIIEGSYLEEHDFIDTTDGVIKKKALIFEFTGHTCKSCPKAHRTIEQIETIYGEQIVTVAFHTGYFARTFTGEKFNTDFRTPQGNEMEAYFEFTSFPVGLVGQLDKTKLSSYSSWPSEVNRINESESPVNLVSLSSYDPETRTIEVLVNIKNKSAINGDVNLAVYLVEDGIVSWQKDEDNNPVDVEDYIHNHVFRTSAGSVWGEALSDSECSANANVQIKKYLQVKTDWVPKNCNIVSFIYETVSREVIQCTSEILIK